MSWESTTTMKLISNPRLVIWYFLGFGLIGLLSTIRAWELNTGQFELTRWSHYTLSPLDAFTVILLTGYTFIGVGLIQKKVQSPVRRLMAYPVFGLVLLGFTYAWIQVPKF